ncbi:DUF1648 domain-containing protein [Gordonia hydrophobica]|uniref:DUF1648 domain-containing protein n=1 Tax=Gordonia hydrophobica TaxID=40516 RepID=A0ABZ2TZZ0_9ACTN|nr:DUF1648 domain-containing protein [Gordonia hydrophobica]MBM7366442.1 uncharacterized membrane protein YhaH (DUF805 family) [Gordonia hydrophobica]
MNTPDPRPAENSTRRTVAYLAVGLVVPAISVLASVTAQLIAWPRLPNRIAVHWNAAGEADRWGSAWVPLALTVVIGLALPLLIVVPNLRPLRSGGRGPSFRAVAAITAAAVAGPSYLLAATVVAQADGGTADVTAAIGIMIAVAVVIGLLGWLAIPRDLARASRPVQPLPTTRGERLAWVSTETVAPWVAVCTVVALIVAGLFVVLAAVGGTSTGGIVPALIVTVVVVALIATTIAFHVRIDADGLRVRSLLGVPRFHVPIDDIENVDVVDIRAIGDFGGYGIRLRSGALGIILRSGPAVEVTRRSNGRRVTVTVSDAGTAAATLATVSARQR